MADTAASEKFTRATPRPEKVAVVTEVRDRLSSASAALLTEYRGLTVAELAQLRTAVGKAGGEYRVYKNTLVRRAAVELGRDELVALLEGPTAIAFVDGDPVAVAKSLREFSKANPNLVVKGGLLGEKVLSATETGALADLAPREVVLAQLAGAIAAPLRQMAGLLQALPRNLAYGLSALLDKRRADEPQAPVAEAPAEPAAAVPEAPEAETAAADSAEAPAPEPEPAAVPEASAPEPEAAAEAPATDEVTDEAPGADEAPAAAVAGDETPEPNPETEE